MFGLCKRLDEIRREKTAFPIYKSIALPVRRGKLRGYRQLRKQRASHVLPEAGLVR